MLKSKEKMLKKMIVIIKKMQAIVITISKVKKVHVMMKAIRAIMKTTMIMLVSPKNAAITIIKSHHQENILKVESIKVQDTLEVQKI